MTDKEFTALDIFNLNRITLDDFTIKHIDYPFPANLSFPPFGPIFNNEKCEIATYIDKNKDFINIKGLSKDNRELFCIDDECDHFSSGISNDGNWVVFTRTDCGIEELCIFSVEDKSIRVIDSRKNGSYSRFAFNDDSSRIEYVFSSINPVRVC